MSDARDSAPPTDALSVGVLTIDTDGFVAYANASAVALLGASARRRPRVAALGTLGRHIGQLTGRVAAEGRQLVEREAHGPDGPVDLILTPQENGDILVELIPVAWHVRVHAGRQAESQQAAFRQMLRSLAHELKNPLGGLRGAAQLLAREVAGSKLTEYCQVIVAEADRLSGLLERLSDRGTARGMSLLNVHAVMERVYQLSTARGGAVIERDYDPSIPDVQGDRDGLIQAILNLVNNAVEAGAEHVVLRSRIRRRGPEHSVEPATWIALEVADDGPGVDPDLSPLIFYPMVTGKPEGTGLGLSVVQTVAANHGGMLDFKSRPGQTVFTVYLPLEADD